MKLYHIQSTFYQAWVDLESIQAIYDVQVMPEQYWGDYDAGMFSIQFAFQDKSKTVHTFAKVRFDGEESKRNIVRAQIEELRELHTRLVLAWSTRGHVTCYIDEV